MEWGERLLEKRLNSWCLSNFNYPFCKKAAPRTAHSIQEYADTRPKPKTISPAHLRWPSRIPQTWERWICTITGMQWIRITENAVSTRSKKSLRFFLARETTRTPNGHRVVRGRPCRIFFGKGKRHIISNSPTGAAEPATFFCAQSSPVTKHDTCMFQRLASKKPFEQ